MSFYKIFSIFVARKGHCNTNEIMLSKSTEYAFRSLVYIQLKNWEGYRPGIEEIAKETDSPQAFTAKILQNLVRYGLLMSLKGRGGGFFFNNDNQELSLIEVVNIMEGKGFFHRCGFGLNKCSDENPCPLHKPYAKIRDGFEDIIKKETVQSLALQVKNGEAILNRFNNNN